ncbi:inositol monophosphatase family protein [Aliarcobacter skirrowii]|uniref:Inositol monophosphatase family protein n=2 Tax=Aliarcobacter skirrowii TaxID=28200 RepID=A0AAD0SMI4_9BACT|nr:inositol monophosphatase family protein [Aliarcobacter skirrowii]AXX85265.1 inositol monophosphatase family protein [Aliarcobacter skirrowii CCUG 10374]MDX4070005.1 inositol monophosphatase family protein [Aliarcobacter skirrowii]SUU96203.1 Inositol-1-monophosphatase [Aliarcobacter skirrowii]
MENIKNAVIKANIEVLNYLKNSLKKDDFIYTNQIGFGGDNSLKIDIIFENIFIKHLKEFGNIFSEECGLKDFKKDITFIIDPLDGSNNFFSNLPYYGTSVAIKKDEEIIGGFVANLALETLVYRFLDDEVIYLSLNSNKELKNRINNSSKVAVFERGYKYPDICKILNDKNIKFRVLGATAISLANARDYDFVLFMGELRAFDIDAAMYICKDLYKIVKNNLIFITKSKDCFNDFKEIIKHF